MCLYLYSNLTKDQFMKSVTEDTIFPLNNNMQTFLCSKSRVLFHVHAMLKKHIDRKLRKQIIYKI